MENDFIIEEEVEKLSSEFPPSYQLAIKLLDRFYGFISSKQGMNNYDFIKTDEYLTTLKSIEVIADKFEDIKSENLRNSIDELTNNLSEYFYNYHPNSEDNSFGKLLPLHHEFFEQFILFRNQFRNKIPEHSEIFYLSSIPMAIIIFIISIILFIFFCI